MKKVLTLSSVLIIFLLATSCEPKNQAVDYCNSLVTDTAGTNDSARIMMPTAFTPNSDGINDVMFPFVLNIKMIEFKVRDSKNNVVFETTQINDQWKPNIEGNHFYTYVLKATTNQNHKIEFCGTISLLKCVPQGRSLGEYIFPDQIDVVNNVLYATNENIKPCQ